MDPDETPYLKIYALTNLAWDADSQHLYESHRQKGFEFRNLNNLFGHVISSGKPVISNDPAHDARRGGLPKGHPAISAFLGIPVYYGERLVGEIGLANRTGGYDEEVLEFVAPVVAACGQIIVARQDQLARRAAEESLARIAERDGLTNLANRRRLDEYLDQEWRRGTRYSVPLSLIMIDIDHFKQYNDHYGHQAGDDCLVQVAEIMQACMRRPSDLVARYGGEEFVCVLPDTSLHGALAVARAIQKKMKLKGMPHAFSRVSDKVTLSMGVTTMLPSDDSLSSELLSLADQYLYQAKESGRNRIASEEGSITP